MSFLFPLAAVKQQNKQIVLIDNIIILWSLRAKHIYLETTYLLITFRVYLSFLQWTSQKGCNVFLLKSESIMAIAPMSVCGSGGCGIKNPPLATYLDDSQLRYIVWVNVGVYFWFGLSFGSPNPTSDFVTDDDHINMCYNCAAIVLLLQFASSKAYQ